MKPTSYAHLPSARKPRALRYALLVALAAAALCWLAPWRVSARRQPKNSTVNFVFEVDPYGSVDGRGSTVDLKVRNELDESEPARKLSVRFGRPEVVNTEGVATLQGEGQLNLNTSRQVLVSPRARGDEKEEHADQTSHFMTFGDVNWPGAEEARLSATQESSQVVIYVLSLPLPPSRYAITADIKSGSGAGEPERVVSISKELSAGSKYSVPVKARSTFELLLERFGNRESLLITIIVGLVGVVAAVLKDKIKEAANWVLDGLGKFGSGKLAERRFRRKYLAVVAGRHKHLRLVGFSSGVSRPLLEEVFVSLRISSHGQPALGDNGHGAGAGASSAIPFASALAQYPKMVILGAPGAGKTTTLSYALLTFAGGRQKERFGLDRPLLPIFVPLRRLSGGGRSILEDLIDPAAQILPNDLLKDLPKRYFERRLDRGECLVLLDGLDEVVDEKTYREVADKINDLAATYPENRFVVTCRVAGWRSYLSGDFAVLQTQDFSRDEIQKFVLGWHRAVITQSEYGRLYFDKPDRKEFERDWARHYEEKVKPAIEIKSRNLLNQIDSNNRIHAIAVNPMLLSLTCLVHSVKNILPRGRTILYWQCLEQLIDSWDRSRDIAWHQPDRTTPNQKEAVLREIAFDFQVRGKGEDTREKIEALIADISKRLGVSVPAPELLEEIELRSGLLIERSIGVFGFSHLTLQEYLVAKHIQLNPLHAPLLHENIGKQEWREVLLLYAGLLDDATELVWKILKRRDEESFDALTLAARYIGDSQNCDPKVTADIIERLLERLFRDRAPDEEVIKSLAALAVDFTGEAKSPREYLVERLIDWVKGRLHLGDDHLAERVRCDCVTILGWAKATAALETITNLLLDESAEVQDAAASALVSFGNLALGDLAASLGRVSDMAVMPDRDDRRELRRALALSADDVPEDAAYFARTIGLYIRVLRNINTGGSAKLLLRMYDVPNGELRQRVSLALARMLSNPFIEADLQQVRKESLPAAVRINYGVDDNTWPYKNLPPGSGFPQLANRIVVDLYEYWLTNTFNPNAPSANLEETSAIPLKLTFPALLKYINRIGGAGRIIQMQVRNAVWAAAGFNPLADAARLNLLATQIHNSYSTTLSATLQNAGVAEADSEDAPTRWKVRLTVWVSNLYFTGYLIYCLAFLWLLASFFYNNGDGGLRLGLKSALFLHAAVPVLSYLSVVAVTQWKLRRRLFSRSTLGTLAFPVNNILKVFRNSVASRRWAKFFCLQVPLQLFSPLFIFMLVSIPEIKTGSDDLTLVTGILGIQVVLVLLSAAYLKVYLMASNPTLQLLLAHPEGAKLVRSS